VDDLKNTYRDAELGVATPADGANAPVQEIRRDAEDIGTALDRDLGNLGDDVREGADTTFPDPQVSDRTM
jgi:hypothetical protein